MKAADLIKELKPQSSEAKKRTNEWFFKTGKGEYGEGDKFLGLTVPQVRAIAKKVFSEITLNETLEILHNEYHEARLLALIIFVMKFERAKEDESRKEIFDLYLKNTKFINNWDLVDLSAHQIVGGYLADRPRDILYKLAKSTDLWEKRISIISTFHFISLGESKDTLAISEILLNDNHDLIHKATGWMLREVGKKIDMDIIRGFLKKHHKTMPRTMLRYTIEHMEKEERLKWMAKD